MGSKSKCKKSKSRPKLGGKKPKVRCNRCGMKARRKKDLCKPRSV